MNNKIILSSIVIGVVGSLVIGGTTAFFTDVEVSTANTISAGTIDIAVDGENPWMAEGTVTIEDLKPSQHEYAEYVIKNVGTNPANIFKKFLNVKNSEIQIASEPQCVELGGTWSEGNPGSCTGTTGTVPPLSEKIINDLSVWVYKVDPKENPDAKPVWWQVIYTDGEGKTIAQLEQMDVLLGMLPVNWYMKVQQSYHMNGNSGNAYQGAGMEFDIKLTAEQLKNTVTLENKLFPDGEEPTIEHDKTSATVAYTVKDEEFDYTLTVNNGDGLLSGDYTLIAWEENGKEFAWSDHGNAIALANVTIGADPTVVEGSLDLNQDLINAKLWLIEGTYTPGSVTGAFPWNEDGLFETALMDYYDSLK